MKTIIFILALLTVCVAGNLLVALETFPEFRVLDQQAYDRNIDAIKLLDPPSKEAVQLELMRGRVNGVYGENMSIRLISIDAVSLVLIIIVVFILIVKSRASAKVSGS